MINRVNTLRTVTLNTDGDVGGQHSLVARLSRALTNHIIQKAKGDEKKLEREVQEWKEFLQSDSNQLPFRSKNGKEIRVSLEKKISSIKLPVAATSSKSLLKGQEDTKNVVVAFPKESAAAGIPATSSTPARCGKKRSAPAAPIQARATSSRKVKKPVKYY